MSASSAEKQLDKSKELEITVTGRKSGRQRSTPVWLVREGKTVLLLPVTGSESQWFQNVSANKKIKLSSGNTKVDVTPRLVTDAKRVAGIADKFRKKYSPGEVKKYYSRFDAALELELR
ncbi:MAG TPA: nitroreductase family deazaflavin-dependent oxidoreductase [Candidatus Bathyarchaeia archaeon]|nr:nitroreductase family deazaflavin-dependent oxidoreductase [Candidatus Bathyarchaeia archaeon]